MEYPLIQPGCLVRGEQSRLVDLNVGEDEALAEQVYVVKHGVCELFDTDFQNSVPALVHIDDEES